MFYFFVFENMHLKNFKKLLLFKKNNSKKIFFIIDRNWMYVSTPEADQIPTIYKW